MSKSILVIDTPENCTSCQMGNMNLYDMSKGGVYCQLNKKQNISWESAKNGKPDWCPLKDMPEKKKLKTVITYFEGWNSGYNGCIDEILKGANGNEQRSNRPAWKKGILQRIPVYAACKYLCAV